MGAVSPRVRVQETLAGASICEVGAADSYLAVRRGELEGTRYHLESEQESNRIGVAGRG